MDHYQGSAMEISILNGKNFSVFLFPGDHDWRPMILCIYTIDHVLFPWIYISIYLSISDMYQGIPGGVSRCPRLGYIVTFFWILFCYNSNLLLKYTPLNAVSICVVKVLYFLNQLYFLWVSIFLCQCHPISPINLSNATCIPLCYRP